MKHFKVQLILTSTFLQCCLFYLVSHRISLNPRHDWPNLHGFKNSKSYFLSQLKCCLTSCACGQAWNPDSVQGGQKQGQRPASCLCFSLHFLTGTSGPTLQDFLYFNFPHRRGQICLPQDIWQCLGTLPVVSTDIKGVAARLCDKYLRWLSYLFFETEPSTGPSEGKPEAGCRGFTESSIHTCNEMWPRPCQAWRWMLWPCQVSGAQFSWEGCGQSNCWGCKLCS